VPDVDKPVGLCGQLTVVERHSLPIWVETHICIAFTQA